MLLLLHTLIPSLGTYNIVFTPLYIYIYIYYVAMVTAGLYIAYTPHQYST